LRHLPEGAGGKRQEYRKRSHGVPFVLRVVRAIAFIVADIIRAPEQPQTTENDRLRHGVAG
jgi:hypothetical protein